MALRQVAPKPLRKPKPLIAKPAAPHKHNLPVSTLKIFDIPIDRLVDNADNPNQMDEATFDQFVQKVKEDGFDEPIQVVPFQNGKYKITGGHHRKKAAQVLGMKAIPAVIKEGWSEDKQAMELVARNMTKGEIDPEKFTTLYNNLRKKGYDESMLKLKLGITKKAVFDKLFKSVSKALPASARKKLDEAKETITSVEGLSSTLNSIFKEHGSDLDHNFCIFQFGGKKHHYIVADKDLSKKLDAIEEMARDKGLDMTDVMNHLLKQPNLAGVKASTKVQERADKRNKPS